MLKIVIDTNLWIRALLGGPMTTPVLDAWKEKKFQVVISNQLLDELDEVWQRPRLRKLIRTEDAEYLLEQLRWRGLLVTICTVPPRCRDPKDHPVLATAIDGHADAIVSGDGDLRADDELRKKMTAYGVEIWGIDTLLAKVS
ncbi:putative toxin-antitoxin system toxin component, PIN family [Desulfococcaceae bacterium HSG8]|nr:putative toxin-antitoxin system toxin component, PIN family [Desulfococcaceae bacterium HSG8]